MIVLRRNCLCLVLRYVEIGWFHQPNMVKCHWFTVYSSTRVHTLPQLLQQTKKQKNYLWCFYRVKHRPQRIFITHISHLLKHFIRNPNGSHIKTRSILRLIGYKHSVTWSLVKWTSINSCVYVSFLIMLKHSFEWIIFTNYQNMLMRECVS